MKIHEQKEEKGRFFVGNRREGECFRQRNLMRGGGSRRGGVASLRSLANGCLAVRPREKAGWATGGSGG